MNTVEFRPNTDQKINDYPHKVDGRACDLNLSKGQPAEKIAGDIHETFDRSLLPEWQKGMRQKHFIVKRPGSDIHKYPAGLENIGKLAANHQYSISSHANQKFCILTVRETTPELSGDLIGTDWHAHSFDNANWLKMNLIKLMGAVYSLQKCNQFAPSFLFISTKLMLNEYIYSDTSPSFVQSEIADHIDDEENSEGIIAPNGETQVPHERAEPRSLTFLTSGTFHRAPCGQEMDDNTSSRLFIDILYFPTQSMKSQL